MITLSAQEWAQAIQLMSYAPMREAMPFIQKIDARRIEMEQQFNSTLQAKGNGQEEAHDE